MRAGNWLLCHALQDTVLRVPAEYFHRAAENIPWYYACLLTPPGSPP